MEQAARMWGWFLAAGIALLILGFCVFSVRPDTLDVLGILAGIAFIFVGFNFIFASSVMPGGWKWLYIIGGIVAIAAGIVAFANPYNTVLALSMLVGWFLLIAGVLDVIRAFMNVHREYWWLGLLQSRLVDPRIDGAVSPYEPRVKDLLAALYLKGEPRYVAA
ncbi:MAG: HdeD family acid-resistance protein, partial [Gaiellaceae bacterium]